jgi:chemotaxis signal transduction protein
VNPEGPRLCLLLDAAGTRYVVEAVAVAEVARPAVDQDTLHGHLGVRDLSLLLGGEDERRPGTVLVLDTSPTLAVRVREVEGVFDVTRARPLALGSRLISLLSPVVRAALTWEGRLFFELDVDGVVRGLPRQHKRPEISSRAPVGPCLQFESAGQRFALPLTVVRQVVSIGQGFNRAPGRGPFLGAVVHQDKLLPAFSLTGNAVEPLLVLADVGAGGEGVALAASRADGVKLPDALTDTPVLDLEHMFS